MTKRRISMTDLVVGQPLPWDVFSESGSLLVRKGHVVANSAQIENMIARGSFVAVDAYQPSPQEVRPPSVLRFLNSCNKRLHTLLHLIANGGENQRERVMELVKIVTIAVDLQPNVALATILHNQKVGTYTVRHSIDTAVVALLVARSMKKSPEDCAALVAAALTMNVGMLQHQEGLQSKKEALSTQELEFIRNHPKVGVGLLMRAGVEDRDWLSFVLTHHENENGSGYPNGWHSAAIPEGGKIISLADRYCARISARTYRKPLLPNVALRDILLEGKKTIDPQLASIFIKELGIYPIGTYVRLENGEIGIVTGKGSNTMTPVVDSLVGPRGAPLDVIIKRDTGKPLAAIRDVLTQDQAAIGFNLDQIWGRIASE